MEEARQHPALSPEQLAFAAVWLAGPLLLTIGVFLALTFGNAGIVVGLIGQAVSKTVAAFWAFLRPQVQTDQMPIWWRFAGALFWCVVSIAVGRGI